MPRITLPSKQPDGSPNWVDLRDPDDFWAEDLFKLHRAVRIKSGPAGETDYSPTEMMDDRVNAFLGAAITGWSFTDKPIPANVNVAPADVILGRSLKAKDWSSLKKQAQPLMDELEGEGLPDPTKSEGAADPTVPVPVE